MTTALPSNISYGYVVGRFLEAVGDGSDPDRNPDAVPVVGATITFTPSAAWWINAGAVPPVTIYPLPVVCSTDVNGYLIDGRGAPGVYLVATDDPDLNPSGSTYKVTIAIPGMLTRTFYVAVPANVTTDLSLVSPVAASAGNAVVVGPPGPPGPPGVDGGLARLPAYVKSSAVALANSYSADLCAYNLKPSNTRRWRRGIGQAASGQLAAEVWAGDSLTGGCININGYIFDRLNAIPRQYERNLSVPIAGTGMVMICDGTHRDARWTVDSNWSDQGSCSQASFSGAVATFVSNLAGTVVSVSYYDYPGSAFSVKLDGVTIGTVTSGGNGVWKTVSFTGVTVNANSQVLITTTTATLTIIAAIAIRKSYGYIVNNCGVSGTASSDWTAQTGNYGEGNIWIQPSTAVWNSTDNPAPSVVHCTIGYFDFVAAGSPTTFLANLTTIRNLIPNSDFVLYAMPVPGNYVANQSNWLAWNVALYQLADTLDVPLFDYQDLMGGYAAEAALNLNGDTLVHLKPEAYGIMGRATARAL